MKLNLRKKFWGACAVLLAALALGITPACSSTDEESSEGETPEAKGATDPRGGQL